MKLSSLDTVEDLVASRGMLERQLQGPLTGWIDGILMDPPMLALLRPVVETELRARICQIDRQLAELGVEAD